MRAMVAGLLGAATLAPAPALAAERLEGYFIAFEACEAFQSKNQQTNPGGVLTEPFRAYEMIALNAPGGDFFQVRVPGAPVTADRWVHVGCGLHVVAAGTPVTPPPDEPLEPAPGEEAAAHLLALSWQPAFCEYRPEKAECRDLNAGNLPLAETQLALHGLWPQPESNVYCGVPAGLVALDKASQWADLPEVALDEDTREALTVAMPGTASFLERHEWIKHGTCHRGAGAADEYYDDTLLVLDAINASEVARLLAARVGGEVEAAEIRQAFDAAFGPGAGERVQMQCAGDGGRTLVRELRIALSGVIGAETDPGTLLRAAAPVSAGCPRGAVDPAGLQ
jgi:ribonuclease T2